MISHLRMLRYLMLIDITSSQQDQGDKGTREDPVEQQHQHQPPKHQQRMDDSMELIAGRPYNWKDWCLVSDSDFLYIWSDAAVLWLKNDSNIGWFIFILDDKLERMEPDGDISYSLVNIGSFLRRLQQARSQVLPGVQTQPILSTPGPTKLAFGNWTLQCEKKGELVIQHSHIHPSTQQATVLREDLAGFIFESTRGTTHSFIARTSLGPEISSGWTDKWGRRFFSKQEHVQERKYESESDLNTAQYLLTELVVDDMSLPGLCTMGLLEMWPCPKRVKLVFRNDKPSFSTLYNLTLSGLTDLCLQREENHGDEYVYEFSSLLRLLSENFNSLLTFSLIDIIPASPINNMIKSIRNHSQLRSVSIIRCDDPRNSDQVDDALVQEINEEGKMKITVEHGQPQAVAGD